LIVGDVGQNSLEEVNIVTKGGNYGWNLKEGSFLFDVTANGTPFVTSGPDPISGLIDPIFEYDHDEGVAVIGGFVYRGTAIPELAGKYIFGELGGPLPRRIGRLFAGDLSTGLFEELRIGLGDRSLGQRMLARKQALAAGEERPPRRRPAAKKRVAPQLSAARSAPHRKPQRKTTARRHAA